MSSRRIKKSREAETAHEAGTWPELGWGGKHLPHQVGEEVQWLTAQTPEPDQLD